MINPDHLKIALAHDYLIKNGGAEKVLQVFHEMFPTAPVFTLLYDEEGTRGKYQGWDIRTSPLQHYPGVKIGLDYYRALMPEMIETLDFSEFDLVISGCSSFIKGIITQPKTYHYCYLHTPTRFLWMNVQSHISRGKFVPGTKFIIPKVLHNLRQWDFLAAMRPDQIVCNSKTAQARTAKIYRRDSTVIYPPVEIERFINRPRQPNDYFLIVSRLEPHKDIDLAIAAANESKLPLKIIGEGRDRSRLEKLAGQSVELLGALPDEAVADYYASAKAFLAPQVEDFGLTMVEALASGCPVVARAEGGALEIVEPGQTGILVKEMSVANFGQAMMQIDKLKFDPKVARKAATKFSTAAFKENMINAIPQTW